MEKGVQTCPGIQLHFGVIKRHREQDLCVLNIITNINSEINNIAFYLDLYLLKEALSMECNVFNHCKTILHNQSIVSRGRNKKVQVSVPRYGFLPKNTSPRPSSGSFCRLKACTSVIHSWLIGKK